MAVERQFIVKLLADPKQIIADFQLIRGEAEKTFGISNQKLQALLPGFKLLTTAAAGVFGGLVAGAGLAVKAAAESQAELQRLEQILLTTGKATRDEVKALNDQAEALERVGVVAGGNITVLQSQLATFDLQATTIEKLTPAILDYVVAEKGAAATTDDFKSMTNGLAQALNGQFGALTRAGFVLDDTTKSLISNGTEAERAAAIVDVLSSTYGGFNASLRDTTEGQLLAFRNSLNKLKEDIGTALLPAFDNIVRVLAKFADFAAKNSTVVGVFAGVLGALSGTVLLLAGYLKVAAFQKRLMNDEFIKGITVLRNSEGQITRTGTAVKGISSAFAGLLTAQAVAAGLNEITGASQRLSDQVVEAAAALNQFEDGTGSAKDAISAFIGIAQAELRTLDPLGAIGGVVKFESFGREFQLLGDNIKLDVEVLDRAFRKMLESDPAKASQLVDALKAQLAITNPSSRAYKDLTAAIASYEARARTAALAQGGLNSAQAASPVFKLTAGLNALARQTKFEGEARLGSVGAIEKYNAEIRKGLGAVGSSISLTEKLAQAKDKLKSSTTSLATAQISNRNAGEALERSNKANIDAGTRLTAAQDKLRVAMQGFTRDSVQGIAAAKGVNSAQKDLTLSNGRLADANTKLTNASAGVTAAKDKMRMALQGVGKDSKAGVTAARSLAAAQRDLTKAGLAVSDAQNSVLEAEQKLAALRAQKADPNVITNAEFGLEKSKLDVEEATLRIQEAEEALAKTLKDKDASPIEKRRAELALVSAKFGLRDAIISQGESEADLIAIRDGGATPDELADAERELSDAKVAVADALDAQIDALERVNEEQETYRKLTEGIRKGDAEFLTLTQDITEAEDIYTLAVKDVNEAIEDQTEAQNLLNDEKEKYEKLLKGVQKGDEDFIELSADIVEAEEAVTDAARDLRDAREQAATATNTLREAEEELRTSRRELRLAGGGGAGRAFGGPVSRGGSYIVGERGPEMFVPTGSGNIIPNNKMGGGGTTVQVVINAGLGTSGTQVGQEIVDVLRAYTRVSGPLSQYVAV